VTLAGRADPAGFDLHYHFDYGPTSAYGQSTALTDAGEGDEYTPANALLTGLAPGTYYYRLVAIGLGGESASSLSTFTLYAPPPEQTGNPFGVGQSTPAPFPTTPLLSTPTFPAQPMETAPPPPKPLTNAQNL
jgi:hypothetical protein